MNAPLPPAIIVHGLTEARYVLASATGRPVTLLSAEGAAGSAGVGWWRALIVATRAAHPGDWAEVLDCADATGHALAALRAGQHILVLWPAAPGFAAAAAIAAAQGAHLLQAAPEALDLAEPGARHRLPAWIDRGRPAPL